MALEMTLETLGIPEDLTTVLTNLKLNKLGTPVWKLQKRKNGYSVSIFWRNAEQLNGSRPNNAHGQNRKNQRSRQRMEAFISEKKMQVESLSCVEVNESGIPAVNNDPGVETSRCETPEFLANPATCSCLFRETNTPSANTRNLSCFSERPCCWSNHLQFCGVWREKFPGVNFKTAQNQEGWTPVMEKYYEAKKPIDRKDGSKSNPVRSCDDELWLGSAKEINLHTAKWNPRSDV